MPDEQAKLPAATGPDEQAPAKEKKKPGLIRWSGLSIFIVVVGGIALYAWLTADTYLQAALRKALLISGHDLGAETQLTSNFFAGSVTFQPLQLDGIRTPTQSKRLLNAAAGSIDLDLLPTLLSKDVVLDRLLLDQAQLVMQRYQHPPRPSSIAADAEDILPETSDDSGEPIDWQTWWERGDRWRERLDRWFGGDEEKEVAKSEPPVSIDFEDDRIKHYHPQPTGADARRLPRLLVKELAITELRSRPPARGSPDPFALRSGSLTGSQVTTLLDAGEEMQLAIEATTHAAGPLRATLQTGRRAGSLRASLPEMPLQLTRDPALVGSDLQQLGLQGTAGIDLDLKWQGRALEGRIAILIQDFDLQPDPAAPAAAAQVAAVWQEIRRTHQELQIDEPLTLDWQIGISGTFSQPRLQGGGLAGLRQAIGGLREQLTAKAKALAAAKMQEGKKLVTDEATKQAGGLLKDVLEGKDAGDAAGERREAGEKNLGDGLKRLNPFAK